MPGAVVAGASRGIGLHFAHLVPASASRSLRAGLALPCVGHVGHTAAYGAGAHRVIGDLTIRVLLWVIRGGGYGYWFVWRGNTYVSYHDDSEPLEIPAGTSAPKRIAR